MYARLVERPLYLYIPVKTPETSGRSAVWVINFVSTNIITECILDTKFREFFSAIVRRVKRFTMALDCVMFLGDNCAVRVWSKIVFFFLFL